SAGPKAIIDKDLARGRGALEMGDETTGLGATPLNDVKKRLFLKACKQGRFKSRPLPLTNFEQGQVAYHGLESADFTDREFFTLGVEYGDFLPQNPRLAFGLDGQMPGRQNNEGFALRAKSEARALLVRRTNLERTGRNRIKAFDLPVSAN